MARGGSTFVLTHMGPQAISSSELDDYGKVKVFQQRESEPKWKQVWKECRLLGIKATASVFDSHAESLAELGCDFVKHLVI